LLRRGRDRRENPEPAERIVALVDGQVSLRDARPADTVEAVAAGYRVALDLTARVPDDAARGIDRLDRRLEEERQPGLEPRRDQVLDDLRLTVDHDRAPAGELRERHVVALAVELQVDAAVDHSFAVEPGGDAGLAQD